MRWESPVGGPLRKGENPISEFELATLLGDTDDSSWACGVIPMTDAMEEPPGIEYADATPWMTEDGLLDVDVRGKPKDIFCGGKSGRKPGAGARAELVAFDVSMADIVVGEVDESDNETCKEEGFVFAESTLSGKSEYVFTSCLSIEEIIRSRWLPRKRRLRNRAENQYHKVFWPKGENWEAHRDGDSNQKKSNRRYEDKKGLALTIYRKTRGEMEAGKPAGGLQSLGLLVPFGYPEPAAFVFRRDILQR
ncbi:hypothetical protein SERLA73DRAFT_156471 [Serpula lacrymans var. lacrymans S7.3]|uniref:Uncharacterized protein n=1 Tax=Serpula lacrymans var. lacrymans (strain S7.3) TaxID=936435 RepID=F8QEM2_SERL3|nr:hypothetical protein SERLA73DRAFT_156471 [Serpula lacrymans var. lacrymans S7.3]